MHLGSQKQVCFAAGQVGGHSIFRTQFLCVDVRFQCVAQLTSDCVILTISDASYPREYEYDASAAGSLARWQVV